MRTSQVLAVIMGLLMGLYTPSLMAESQPPATLSIGAGRLLATGEKVALKLPKATMYVTNMGSYKDGDGVTVWKVAYRAPGAKRSRTILIYGDEGKRSNQVATRVSVGPTAGLIYAVHPQKGLALFLTDGFSRAKLDNASKLPETGEASMAECYYVGEGDSLSVDGEITTIDAMYRYLGIVAPEGDTPVDFPLYHALIKQGGGEPFSIIERGNTTFPKAPEQRLVVLNEVSLVTEFDPEHEDRITVCPVGWTAGEIMGVFEDPQPEKKPEPETDQKADSDAEHEDSALSDEGEPGDDPGQGDEGVPPILDLGIVEPAVHEGLFRMPNPNADNWGHSATGDENQG